MRNILIFVLVLFTTPLSANSISSASYGFGGDRPTIGYIPNFEGITVIDEDEIPSIWDNYLDQLGKKKRPPRVRGNGGQPHGCVTGDTVVTLEGGEKAFVKDLESGDLVINQDRDTVGVYYTLKGKEEGKMVLIQSESGKRIVSTLGHPFYDQEGVSRADSFKKGDLILTVDGLEEIKNLEFVQFTGDVYNMALSPKGSLLDEKLEKKDPFLALTSSEHTVILNGFISGDIIIQNLIVKK